MGEWSVIVVANSLRDRSDGRREEHGDDPLVHFGLFKVPILRGGLSMLFAQNLILMGIFFTIPLYLQIVLGMDALETGIRMLPASIALFISALGGAALSSRFAARLVVRVGLGAVLVAALLLMGTIDTQLDSGLFLAGMAVLGLGMGLIASQLGNVVQELSFRLLGGEVLPAIEDKSTKK